MAMVSSTISAQNCRMAMLMLRELREKSGLTLETLAADIEISVSQLSRIERGEREARIGELQRIAERIRVSVSDLIGEKTGTTLVPLISRTAAGSLEYRQGIRTADVESFLSVSGLGKGDWFALVVQGDSMDRIAPDGSTIFVNRAEFEPMDGKPYIFATTDENHTTFKLWDANGFLLPFSMNPDHRPIAIQENGVRCIGRVRNVFRTLD